MHAARRRRQLAATGHSALLHGGAEAAATPANAKAISDWFPKKERPIAAGWAGVGFSIGAMLAPPIIVIAHVSFGWQGAFLFSGGLALIWVVLWWLFYHSPQQHPNLSQQELDLIREDNEPVLPKLPFLTSLASLCKNKKFYGIAIPAFLAEPARAVFSFWVPLYGHRTRHGSETDCDVRPVTVPGGGYRQRRQRLSHHPVPQMVRLQPRQLGGRQLGDRRFPDGVAGVRGDHPRSLCGDRADLDRRLRPPVISCMLSALVVESFDKNQMATVNGMRGSSARIASFLFTLLIGAVSDTIGFNPLFIAMGFFDLIGALFLIALIAERGGKKTPSHS